MSTYLRAAIEILTIPGGPSRSAIDTAIHALRVHQESIPTSRPVDLDDRVAEAEAIAYAEGWTADEADREWIERMSEQVSDQYDAVNSGTFY